MNEETRYIVWNPESALPEPSKPHFTDTEKKKKNAART